MLNYTNYTKNNHNNNQYDCKFLFIFISCVILLGVCIYTFKFYIHYKIVQINEQIIPETHEEIVETNAEIINPTTAEIINPTTAEIKVVNL